MTCVVLQRPRLCVGCDRIRAVAAHRLPAPLGFNGNNGSVWMWNFGIGFTAGAGRGGTVWAGSLKAFCSIFEFFGRHLYWPGLYCPVFYAPASSCRLQLRWIHGGYTDAVQVRLRSCVGAQPHVPASRPLAACKSCRGVSAWCWCRAWHATASGDYFIPGTPLEGWSIEYQNDPNGPARVYVDASLLVNVLLLLSLAG